MLLTIHRSECSLWLGESPCLRWHRTRFDPSPFASQITPNGFRKLRMASKPIGVSVPVGSRLVAYKGTERARLAVYFDQVGLDADSVWHLAKTGARGFSLEGSLAPA